MLQRIQSLFLGLTALTMVVMVFFPIWIKSDPGTGSTFYFTALGTYENVSGAEKGTINYSPYGAIALLALISCGIAIYEIFQFTNRMKQVKIGALNSLVMAIVLVLSMYFATQFDKSIYPGATGSFTYGFFLPVVAMLSNVVANRFIRRDEKLVRDSDRMR